MRLYFARHGESEANILRVFSNSDRKHGLTDKGRAQAAVLAGKLSTAGIERVIASPLLRARETAQIIATILGLGIQEADELREWEVGVLEGRSDEDAWKGYWELRRDWAAGRYERRIEGGESLHDLARRFVPFVQRLVVDANDGSRILLIGHGGLYCAALPLLLRNIDSDFAERNGLDNASFVVAENTEDGLVCTGWGGIDPPSSTPGHERPDPSS